MKNHSTPYGDLGVALLTACLWAANPIQTQAVTYIIQRMAVMAALFTIVGLYAHLRLRLAAGRGRWGWLLLELAAFACAMLSKENAILFPLSVALIECVFFEHKLVYIRHVELFTTRNVIIAGVLMVVGAALILNVAGNPVNFDYFDKRPFSMGERLLTQPRILIFYLSQIFYPAPWRFSIEHGIDHSLSLFTPWTTLPALLAVFGLVTLAIWRVRKNPLLSFGVLFFFVNHLVESTILPLELVFEHRNYLPSFFLFLPIAFSVHQLMARHRAHSPSVYILLCACIGLCLGAFGMASYVRNKAWKTDYSLWYDAAQKAPGRARPLMALGVAIGWGQEDITGKYDIALNLFQRALKLSIARKNETAQLYGNIALAQFHKGNLPAVIDAFERALEQQPKNRKIRFDFLETLIAMGRWNDALDQAEKLIDGKKGTPQALNFKGIIKLWSGNPEEALSLFQQASAAGLQDPFLYHNIGAAMTDLGHFRRGRWFLRRALNMAEQGSRGKIWIYFSLIENRYKAADGFGARGATFGLLARYGLDEVKDTLKGMARRHTFPPLDIPTVSRLLGRYLVEVATVIGNGPASDIKISNGNQTKTTQ